MVYRRAQHGLPRYEIKGARVLWEPWTFWHWIKGTRVTPGTHAHEVVNIGADGLDFNTRHPPKKGASLLLNLHLPGRADHFPARGVATGVKSREGHHSVRVRVKFHKCPYELAEKIRELGQTVI